MPVLMLEDGTTVLLLKELFQSWKLVIVEGAVNIQNLMGVHNIMSADTGLKHPG